MEEASRPVAKLVAQFMDGEIQLPEIQRSYVWTREKARELVDSIYKCYPSGSILLWENGAGVQTRSAGVDTDRAARPSSLLLDGQQRITSLAAVIEGRPVRMKIGNAVKQAPIKLYFNVNHPDAYLDSDSGDDGEEEEEGEGEERPPADRRIFRFAKGTASDPYWISVTDAFKKDPATLLSDNGIDSSDPDFPKYIAKLGHLADLKKYKYPVQILEKDTPYQVVTDIFVRVNSQGAKLRKADLALAQVTCRWEGAMDKFTSFADECRQRGFDLDEGFLIKCLVSVSTGQNKFNDVGRIDADRLRKDWEKTKRGLHRAIDFLEKEAGIESSDILPTPFLLVPVVCMEVRNGFVLTDELRLKMLRWLYTALIWRRYSRGSTETMLDEDLSSIRDSGDPVADMIERVRAQAGGLEVTAEHIRDGTRQGSIFRMMYILAKKSGAKDWGTGLALSTAPDHGFKSLHGQVFAPADIAPAQRGKRGHREARRLAGDIANTVFDSGRAAGEGPGEYLGRIARDMGDDALASQCMPDDRELWAADRYEEFLARRRDAIADGINGLLASLAHGGSEKGEDLAAIAGGESDTVEFKSSLLYDYETKARNRALKDAVLKEIAALMNAKGGTVYVGVADDKEILGIERDCRLLGRHAGWDKWSLALADAVKTLGPVAASLVSYRPVVIAGRTVARIAVGAGRRPAYLDPGGRGEFVVRMGSESARLSTEGAAAYMRDRFPEGEAGRAGATSGPAGRDAPHDHGKRAAGGALEAPAAPPSRDSGRPGRGSGAPPASGRGEEGARGAAEGHDAVHTPTPDGRADPPPMAAPPANDEAALRAAWLRYDRQVDKEPFDAARDLAEGGGHNALDQDRSMEMRVQACARLAKMYSENLESNMDEFLANVDRQIPSDAAAHCRSRYGSGRVSGLLKWHYCLVLHLGGCGGEWLERAIGLILQSADGTGDNHRASSYIVIAYNLNRWHTCGQQDAVLASALRFARERPHNVFSHKCAHIVADLEGDAGIRDEIRGAMLRAADSAANPDAGHCRAAAARLASK